MEQGVGGVELHDGAGAEEGEAGDGDGDSWSEGEGEKGDGEGGHGSTDEDGFDAVVGDEGEGHEPGDGSQADDAVKESKACLVEAEEVTGDGGHLEEVGDAEEREGAFHDEDGLEALFADGVEHALEEEVFNGLWFAFSDGEGCFNQEGGDDDEAEAEGVDPEADGKAVGGADDAAEGGADDPGEVEGHGLERDGAGEVLFADDFADDGLAAGGLDGLDESADKGDDEDLGEGEDAEGCGGGVPRGGGGEDDGAGDEDFLAVEDVDKDSHEGAEDGDGDHAGECDEPKGGVGAGDLEDVRALGDHLDLSAGEGEEGPDPNEPEVADGEGAEALPGGEVGKAGSGRLHFCQDTPRMDLWAGCRDSGSEGRGLFGMARTGGGNGRKWR